MASRNLKYLQDAGVGIAFGTDTGPPARFQGYFEHMELELMVKAGLTPAQALTAATSGAADCMKVAGQLGALVPGAWADFVVLDKNPLEDIRNTRTIASVWVAGGALPRPSVDTSVRFNRSLPELRSLSATSDTSITSARPADDWYLISNGRSRVTSSSSARATFRTRGVLRSSLVLSITASARPG